MSEADGEHVHNKMFKYETSFLLLACSEYNICLTVTLWKSFTDPSNA